MLECAAELQKQAFCSVDSDCLGSNFICDSDSVCRLKKGSDCGNGKENLCGTGTECTADKICNSIGINYLSPKAVLIYLSVAAALVVLVALCGGGKTEEAPAADAEGAGAGSKRGSTASQMKPADDAPAQEPCCDTEGTGAAAADAAPADAPAE